MDKTEILKAWSHIRKIDSTIPDDTLDFMKDSSIERLEYKVLDFPDIRNKLSPICHTIALLEKGEFELALASLNQSKKSVNYLAGREVYKEINKNIE